MNTDPEAYAPLIKEVKSLTALVAEVQRRLSNIIMPPHPPEPGSQFIVDAVDWARENVKPNSFQVRRGIASNSLRIIFNAPADQERYEAWLNEPIDPEVFES